MYGRLLGNSCIYLVPVFFLHVTLKITGLVAREAAMITVERLFVSVNELVFLQMSSLSGTIAALVTLEWLFS